MSEWRTVTLGDLCDFRGGNAFPQDEQGHFEGYAPFIKVSDLSHPENASSIVVSNNWVSELQVARLKLTLFPQGTSVFAKIGEGMKSGRIRALTRPTAVDNNLMGAVPKPSTEATFLYYLLQTIDISSYAVGSALPYLKQSTLQTISVRVPAQEGQLRIAEVLGALDDKIAANTALSISLDEFASTKVRGALTDETVRLGDVAEITMGSSPKGDALNEAGEGVPFYQGVRDFGMRSPAPRVSTTAPVRMASAGDILVSVRAPVGDVNVANEALSIGRGLAAVRSRHDRQATLFHQLRGQPEAWAPYQAEGTVFASINRDQLHGVGLRTVHPDRASATEAELRAIEDVIAVALTENPTLAATRDALLPQLMSGKLRVRDAERIASEAGA